MRLQVQGLIEFLAACRHRLPAIVCCMLTLWSGIDSQVIRLLQTSSGNLPAPFQNRSSSQEDDDDDDDYVLDLTEKPTPGRDQRKSIRPSLSGLFHFAPTESCLSLSDRRRRPSTMPVSEHEYHNGIGAYLLC
jgi:hypothetical protein